MKKWLETIQKIFRILFNSFFFMGTIKYSTTTLDQWSTEQSRFLEYYYLYRQILQVFVFYENS